MKKIEFSGSKEPSLQEKREALSVEKYDDRVLPEFSKEVPGKRTRESKEEITTDYNWKYGQGQNIKIEKITYQKEERLDDFYRVLVRDGIDSFTIKHQNVTYIIRKTSYEVAQSIYKACKRIVCGLERIVGYFRTTLGNEYMISRVEGKNWTFDKRIARNGIEYIDREQIESGVRSDFAHRIVEKIADIHALNLILGRFTLSNILVKDDSVTVSDLRKMRATRKRSYVVEELKAVLQYLFGIGFAKESDVYAAVAYYVTKNNESCNEWYQSKTGRRAKEDYDVVQKIEQDIFG